MGNQGMQKYLPIQSFRADPRASAQKITHPVTIARRLKLDCQYPPNRKRKEIHSLVPFLLETVLLQSTPVKLSMTDMRLFNNFLLSAYPHLPLGNDEVWVTEIASFAHSVRRPKK